MIAADARASSLIFLATTLSALTGCLDDGGSPKSDSESHFLSGCSSDADCESGFSCLCNLCTVACTDDDACGGLAPGAACVETTGEGACRAATAVADHCGIRCGGESPCPLGLECYLGECRGDIECPSESSWDPTVGYCVTPWTRIGTFSGDQVCGPEYYFVELPEAMNEFRPREDSSVTGGFLAAIPTRQDETLWSFSPNGESAICNNLWGDDQGVWSTGIRRTAGPTVDFCAAPIEPPPLANLLRGCGIYSFALEGRALLPPGP